MLRKIRHLLRLVRYKLRDGKTLSERLNTRYLLTIRNEENFAHKLSYPFTYAKIVVFSTLAGTFLFSCCLYLASTFLAQWFHPVDQERETTRQVLALSLTVDSLSTVLQQKELFLASLGGVIKEDKKMLKGDSAVPSRSVPSRVSMATVEQVTEADAALRAEFEGHKPSPQAMLISNSAKERLHDLFLFSPLRGGIISEKYDAKSGHYGVDLVARKDEPVKCVADGTVIFASFTDDTGYVIAVQHQTNLVSLYKHNSVLLKKAGEFVRAGEILAIIGNTGVLTTGPHLHFEVWYNGVAVNPEMFISL